MPQSLSSSSPLPPLNIGNVVSTGVVLYRSHFQSYLKIALTAILWYVPPLLLFAPAQIAIISAAESGGTVPSSMWLLMLLGFIALIYCSAKYLVNAALIARLAFYELMNQPESVESARNQIGSKHWRFFWVSLRFGVLLVLLYLGLAIVVGFLLGIALVEMGLTIGPFAAAIISGILTVLIIVPIMIWFISRWVIAEVPLAVGEVDMAGQSIDRSWDLTSASVLRVQGVVFVAFLVTLPLLAITNYIPQIVLNQLEPGSPGYWLLSGISTVFSLGVGSVMLPFWQSIKAVLYYDLRNRREGLGLQLKDRNS